MEGGGGGGGGGGVPLQWGYLEASIMLEVHALCLHT